MDSSLRVGTRGGYPWTGGEEYSSTVTQVTAMDTGSGELSKYNNFEFTLLLSKSYSPYKFSEIHISNPAVSAHCCAGLTMQ